MSLASGLFYLEEECLIDTMNETLYTGQQVEDIARLAAQYAVEQVLSQPNLGNEITQETVLPQEGENNMGRQKVYVTLQSGEKVWITGATNSELIQNALNKYGQGSILKPSESFKQYTDKIFDVFLAPRWKPSTEKTNRFLLDKYIMPYFKDKLLNEIDTLEIQSFFKTKNHLSKSYTKQMRILLHEIFENAIEDKRVSEDPTKSKRITLPTKATKREPLDADQFIDLISHIPDLQPKDALLMALLCFTGMRRGEVLGLKWDQVTDDKIHVCAEVIFHGNHPVYNEFVKSDSGIRDLPIPDGLKPYLKDRGEGFVVTGDKLCTQSRFDRAWQRIGKTIDLHGATPHILRHTYLTSLAASGVDPKTIQLLAGHAEFAFTFNHYIGKDKNNMMLAGNKLTDHLKLTRELTSSKPPEALTDKDSGDVAEENN